MDQNIKNNWYKYIIVGTKILINSFKKEANMILI